MVLVAPANEVEMKLALEFALAENKAVCLRYPKNIIPLNSKFDVSACAEPFELGKSVVVKKGTDSAIAIVSYGSVLTEALEAARMLAEDGIAVDVINGSIESTVVLPTNETIDLFATNGSIELNIPISTSAEFSATVGIGQINVSNLNILDTISTNRSLTGTLGIGEGSIALSTANGNIDVIGFD